MTHTNQVTNVEVNPIIKKRTMWFTLHSIVIRWFVRAIRYASARTSDRVNHVIGTEILTYLQLARPTLKDLIVRRMFRKQIVLGGIPDGIYDGMYATDVLTYIVTGAVIAYAKLLDHFGAVWNRCDISTEQQMIYNLCPTDRSLPSFHSLFELLQYVVRTEDCLDMMYPISERFEINTRMLN